MIKPGSLILILLIFIFRSCLSQTGWINQISGTTDSLRSVKFLNSLTGWTAGTNGSILKTTNGGSNWQTSNAGITNDLYSVFVVSDSVLFAAGENGIIIKSTDSGISWQILNSGVNVRLNSIWFVNSFTGFSSGFDGKILKSTNAGENWSILNSGTDIQLNSVFFVTPLKGWTAGYGGIFNTSDGGNSWSPQFIDGSLVLNSIFFSDSLHGWSAYYDNNTFGPENVRTTTGGFEWRNHSMNNSYSISVFFADSNKGWSSGYYGKINFSSDGGTSWTTQKSGTTEHLNSVYFSDSLTGWITGNSGVILKTTNGGILTEISFNANEKSGDFILDQNYPNPFNPSTVISYSLNSDQFISLKVYDAKGNEISVLKNKFERKGRYNITFNSPDLPSGIYYYRFIAGDQSISKKMLLIR